MIVNRFVVTGFYNCHLSKTIMGERGTIMCNRRTYFKNFCGQTGSDCACHGHYSRSRSCLHAGCGKEFKSTCGAQLFCSLECQLQTDVGQLMFQRVDGDAILKAKKERRNRQNFKAVQKHKRTDRGRENNRRYNRERRARIKARAAASAKEPSSH